MCVCVCVRGCVCTQKKNAKVIMPLRTHKKTYKYFVFNVTELKVV